MYFFLHCPHVVFGFQRQLQNLGSIDYSLMAASGDSFASDAVDLVKGMWPHGSLISRSNEDLQCQSVSPTVPVQLRPQQFA